MGRKSLSGAQDVDFDELPRRRLQQLCKKNGIAANKSNRFMADALREISRATSAGMGLQEAVHSGSSSDAMESIPEGAISSEAAEIDAVDKRGDELSSPQRINKDLDTTLEHLHDGNNEQLIHGSKETMISRHCPAVANEGPSQKVECSQLSVSQHHTDGLINNEGRRNEILPVLEHDEEAPEDTVTVNENASPQVERATRNDDKPVEDRHHHGLVDVGEAAANENTNPQAERETTIEIPVPAEDRRSQNEKSSINPSLQGHWKEMVERATRKAMYRRNYKQAPFLKRTIVNRSLATARLKRTEVLTQKRVNSFFTYSDRAREVLSTLKVVGTTGERSGKDSVSQPVFGRKRFMEKALAESAKKMSEKRDGSTPLRNISNQINCADRDGTSLMHGTLPRTPVSICGGKVASIQKRHQEQFKTPLTGKSHQKTVLTASKIASLQRNEILSSRRRMFP